MAIITCTIHRCGCSGSITIIAESTSLRTERHTGPCLRLGTREQTAVKSDRRDNAGGVSADDIRKPPWQHRLFTYSTPVKSHEAGIPYNEECNPGLRLDSSEGELFHTHERVSTSMPTVMLYLFRCEIS